MSVDTNEAALRLAIERWNAGDRDGYLEFYDSVAVIRGDPDIAGMGSIRSFYEGLWTAFPNSHLVIEDVVGADDKLVARFTLTGTHGGPLMGIPPSGRDIRLPGITTMRFANGRCIERWTQSDFLGLLQQIGAIPLPGA